MISHNRLVLRLHRFGLLLLLMLLTVLGAAWLLQVTWHDMKGTRGFTLERLGSSIQLLDFGATDVDGDGFTDLFTSAHNHRQLLLLNQSGNGWTDVHTEMMAQDSLAPGLEIAESLPLAGHPGIYVGWEGIDILLRARGRGGAATVGSLGR